MGGLAYLIPLAVRTMAACLRPAAGRMLAAAPTVAAVAGLAALRATCLAAFAGMRGRDSLRSMHTILGDEVSPSAAISSNGPSAPPAVATVQQHHQAFASIYGARTAGYVPLETWVQTYYRRPRPDLLLGAIAEAARTPGAFVGAASLPGAVFLAEVLRPLCDTETNAERTLQACITAAGLATTGTAAASERVPAVVSELTDTLLRAAVLSGQPPAVAVVKRAATQWRTTTESLKGSSAASKQPDWQLELTAGVAAGLEASCDAVFPPVAHWPIPCHEFDSLQRILRTNDWELTGAGRVYACTRYWHLQMAAAAAHWRVADTGDRLSPRGGAVSAAARTIDGKKNAGIAKQTATRSTIQLAHALSRTLIDALWARFWATGEPACVSRVLDVGAAYAAGGGGYLHEYGTEWVTRYREDQRYSGIPDEFANDPWGAMQFDCARYALWTLLSAARSHVMVGDVTIALTSDLNDAVAAQGAFADEDGLVPTAVRNKLEIMKALFPAVATLREAARADGGIGSGQWPAVLAPSGRATDLLAQDHPTPPLPLGSPSLALPGGGASSVIVQALSSVPIVVPKLNGAP